MEDKGEIPGSTTTTTTTTTTMKTTPTKPKRKQRRRKFCSNNITTLFCSTLVALKTPLNPYSKTLLLNNSLKLLHLIHPNSSSSSSSLEPLINAVFTVLPPLLLSRCDDVVCAAAKMVGMASMLSIQIHHRIASDIDILKSLCVNVLRVQKMDAKKAVCNAVLDLSLTSLASQNLLHLSALNYLLLGFLQVQKLVASPLSITVMENAGDKFLAVEYHQDEVPLLILNAAATLTNFCNTEQLKNIPSRLKEAVIPYLREIWSKVHEQLLASKIPDFFEVKHCYLSNLTFQNLAECIFRLSMDAPGLTHSISSEVVIRHLFGPWSSSFTDFILKHWESSPILIKNQQRGLVASQSFFSSFMESLTCEETLPKFLSSTLGGMVSCPPVDSNEIDSLSSLNDVRETLGSPMIYHQDIRVVRTNLLSKSEEHYFQDSSSNGNQAPRCLSADDISKCETAYREGYTIALRGMGFRFSSVAAITREIASFFGQPSVGANLYVTPPNSQGLSCHYDDHCVFICQLYGDKQWTIFPQPVVKLPRLYECLEIPQDILVESRQILLRQGDVLYLPRGFAHEACTITDVEASSKCCESSIHLTLALEVEPPFEWEGLAHVALHHWSQKKGSDISHGNSAMQAISVTFLHVAIKLISNTEPMLRKACLVAASSFPTVTQDWLDKYQRATFNQVIAKINELSCFTDSLEFLQMAIHKDNDPFHWLRWLEHLNGKEVPNQDIWVYSLDGICSSLSSIYQHKDNAEAEFVHVKSNFCNEVLFDDAKESFKTLHAMYKDARMQYMNGMLSLHR